MTPINAQYLAIAFDPGSAPNVGIATQPQSQNIFENHTATFSVTVTNTGGAVSYQWQLDSGGGFADIAGANSSSYTTPLRTVANNGNQYRVIVNVPGRSITSAAATLNVTSDPVPPKVLAVRGTRSLAAIRITFDEVLSPATAVNPANYSLTDTNGAALTLGTPTLGPDQLTVTIPTSAQNPGAFYTAHIQNVQDAAGNTMVPTNIQFQAWVISPGFILFEAYDTGGGNNVSDLTSNPNYPNNPRDTVYLTSLDSRGAYPDDSHEGYGARISGFLIPPQTTNYNLYLRSDDSSQLWLSTNSNPTNVVKIQEETACCNGFSLHGTTNSLVGGQPYYIELLYKEGTGGDFGQAAIKDNGDPTNPDTLTPIRGSLLATLADPVGASVTITQQPANYLFVIGSLPLFSQDFNSSGGGFTVDTPVAFDGPWAYNAAAGSWQESGQDAEDGHPNTSMLNSPTLNVTASGTVVLSFTHRYSFEHDGTAWDGGQVRVSINGGPFVTVPGSAFTQNGYPGTVSSGSGSDLHGQEAFIATSPGYATSNIVSRASLGSLPAGSTVRVQFIAASDTNTRGQVPNWEINDVTLTQGSGAAGATFTVGANAVNAQSTNPPRFYQWYRNNGSGFVAIPNANSASYTFVPTQTDSGAQFRVVVYIPGANATSASATLTVSGGSSGGPVLRQSYSNGTLTLSWDAPARLQFATSLNPPINWRDVDTGGATTYAVVLSNQFTVNLDPAQEATPPGARSGIGSGSIILSNNNVLLVDVVYSGLSGNRSADHFHAPAARGANAGVVYDLGSISAGTTSGTIKGSLPLVNLQYGGKSIPAQIQDIHNGLWYLNIHSSTFGGGEIRGQVEPGARFYRLISP